jgi:hypothetical protein
MLPFVLFKKSTLAFKITRLMSDRIGESLSRKNRGNQKFAGGDIGASLLFPLSADFKEKHYGAQALDPPQG